MWLILRCGGCYFAIGIAGALYRVALFRARPQIQPALRGGGKARMTLLKIAIVMWLLFGPVLVVLILRSWIYDRKQSAIGKPAKTLARVPSAVSQEWSSS